MTTKSSRKLLVGAVGLVPGRIRGDIPAASRAQAEVESLIPEDFFDQAPFRQIGVIIRYGSGTDLALEYQQLHEQELPVAVQVDMQTLRKAEGEGLHLKYRQILLSILVSIGQKFSLPHESLLEALESQDA